MRLHIFGASGSGVTTVGQTLSEKLNIPYFDSDHYFWENSDPPYTIRRDPEQRNSMLLAELNKHTSWILGGSVIHWGDVFPEFDLIVFLWVPQTIRLDRLKKREFLLYGNIIHTDPTRAALFDKFITWARDYDEGTGIANRTLKAHEDWLNQVTSPVLKIQGDIATADSINLTCNKLADIKPARLNNMSSRAERND